MIATINLMDTSVTTDNIGDKIICNSIVNELNHILNKVYVTNTSTHDDIGATGRKSINKADISVLLGTNALSSYFKVGRPDIWKINFKDLVSLSNKVLLCGAGWRNYQGETSILQKLTYQRILTKQWIHSVRDSHTKNMLAKCGISNVVNTSCPTLWSLDQEFCKTIPTQKSGRVVFTLTRHKPDPNDLVMIMVLIENYDRVLFWPQQIEDYDYLSGLVTKELFNEIELVPPSLSAYDCLLDEKDIDFVGTRLHGGIRAIQKGNRALVVSIDNRATEISRDTKLPTIKRSVIPDQLETMIRGSFETNIVLPHDEINRWKDQFLKIIPKKLYDHK
ncbi:MAG: polysaccharide pyruvyl transferase family protein [Reichenbachiella sp.]|uniref:polysaccharide pyruvyl transferase family protein n=1 Tax=Reichenbachiella sp. TaxID=2184521 RepID=UPI00296614DB|nr:polysaccharide pyruvyl transferase family protein [Reichenbachiella sp.]MDW3208238.1 polysaccharide pyruvyl transferase family protein [Reichenbachiella sp.]